MNEIFNTVRDDLLNLPLTILDKTNQLIGTKKKKEEFDFFIKKTESKTTRDVEYELDSNGKPKFSNSDKRKLEVELRLSNNPDYQSILTYVDALKKEMDELSLQLEFINNKFKAARALALIIGDDK